VTDPDLDEQPEDYHVSSAKMIVGGVMLAANQSAEQDMDQALDALFNHPNVGPFIATRLIQRLVTSNPSPAYVARVASVFNNNGSGVRGDLGAVVQAILMDFDAMDSYLKGDLEFGKLREPLLMVTHLYRAFDAVIDPAFAANPEWVELINNARRRFAQSPLGSPSVFNFFKPGYAQPGLISDSGFLSPEFQVVNESQVVNVANFFFDTVVRNPPPSPSNWLSPYQIQIDGLLALANNPPAVLDRLNVLLMSGQMSQSMHQIITDRVNEIPSNEPTARVTEAIYYVITSPEYLVQR
jgi:hypothetical protein